VGTAVRDQFGVDVIAGEETERRLPEAGLPDECVASAECRTDIARRLDADELLLLVIIKLGDDIQIDSTWAHAASGDTASRPRVTIAAHNDQAVVLAEAAPTLLPHMKQDKAPDPVREFIVVPPAADGRYQRTMPLASWIGAGVAGAALAGGTVFALSARKRFHSLDDDGCRDKPCNPDRVDVLRKRALTADILFGVAGAAAITSVILYFAQPKGRSQPERSLEIRPGPGAVGLSVGGDF